MTPVESVVKGNNANLIIQAAKLWIKPGDNVLDVTFGGGKWWTRWCPQGLHAHDLALDGVDFRVLPEADGSIDVVVFDPPYTAKGGRKTSGISGFDDRYGLRDAGKSPLDVQMDIGGGISEAYRVLKPKGILLLKVADYISSGKFVQGHAHAVDAAIDVGFEQVDELIHWGRTGPQPKKNRDGSPRRQVHSRRAHSFLCVFRKKPVRVVRVKAKNGRRSGTSGSTA